MNSRNTNRLLGIFLVVLVMASAFLCASAAMAAPTANSTSQSDSIASEVATPAVATAISSPAASIAAPSHMAKSLRFLLVGALGFMGLGMCLNVAGNSGTGGTDMTPEQKKFYEELEALSKSGVSLNDAILRVAGGLDDVKKVKALEAAVKQLETDLKAQAKAVETQIERVKKIGWDGQGRYRGVFGCESDARAFGLLCLAVVPDMRSRALDMFKKDYGQIYQRDMASSPDNVGGGLVPIEFSARIKRLIEVVGAFDRYAFHMPMTEAEMIFNRQTGEVTAYITGEGTAPTESDLGFNLITLIAKEYNVLTYYPRSLAEDALAPIGELVARSMVYAIASKTDDVGFLADGTKTYISGQKGLLVKLKDIYTANSSATGGGVVKGTGSGWSGLVLNDFLGVAGTLPAYADAAYGADVASELTGVPTPQARWFCSRNFFFGVMMKLLTNLGGVRLVEAQGRYELLGPGGAPVTISQKFPRATASAQIPCVFGDLALAATIGDRMALSIEQSTQYKFAERQVTVLGRVRKAVTVDSVGTTAVAGPVVGLATG